ncbi:uncharacterized protein Z520_01035 [Fonsecaea multimorphosa CBS 102226]|uniref:Cytochrome P450 monooxygenase n=1 Tax=Fonsecaea multimorphosa CBS 102226 TaxID=1442371 RepID=A0A0D2KGJ1_9EURO|nr:uncharacterized protein Z520_01035 [Fonsecaea multimorphosa CBS 102226]KIY02570.1 hypothetical protein Z520_01035 [Fonsecaea multimorphosa CBS 102226]OAL31436.1 hypothetical protein AYO22_01028 [Fonsecaea multimorphosa]
MEHVLDLILSHSLAFTAFALSLFTVTFFLKRYLRLRHVPGPLLAALTDLWFAYRFWTGTNFDRLATELHQKYGPVVRLGPNRLIFSKASAIPVIHRTTDVMPKSSFYLPLRVMVRGRETSSFGSILDEKRMSAIKRLLLGNFTINSFLQQEAELDHTMSSLVRYLEDTRTDIAIGTTLGYWAFDSISRIALTEDQAFLSRQEDCGNTIKGANERITHWQYWGAMPTLERWLFKNPIMQRMGKSSPLGASAAQQLQKRLHEDKDVESQLDLLGKYLAASRRAPELIKTNDVVGFLVSTMHAGSEPVGQTTAGILITLLQHPDKMAKLEKEILSASLSDMPQFSEVHNLPYLNGVIREFLRLSTSNVGFLERTVPEPGAMIDGVWVPGGTEVSVSRAVLHKDADIFGADPEQFQPERWIGLGDGELRRMDHADLSFSLGRRMCIGRNLAMIEMKKGLARLIKTFKVVPSDPNDDLQPTVRGPRRAYYNTKVNFLKREVEVTEEKNVA